MSAKYNMKEANIQLSAVTLIVQLRYV